MPDSFLTKFDNFDRSGTSNCVVIAKKRARKKPPGLVSPVSPQAHTDVKLSRANSKGFALSALEELNSVILIRTE